MDLLSIAFKKFGSMFSGAGILVVRFVLSVSLIFVPAPLHADAHEFGGRDSAVVARIRFDTVSDLNRVAAELDIWEVDHEAGFFVALLSGEERDDLVRAGYEVIVLPDRTATLHSTPVWSASQQEGIPGFGCYRTVEETFADLAVLAASHPDIARWIEIGDSWEKITPAGEPGYDIHALVLTNRAIPGPKPKFVLMAAIHAREYTTAELATRFAEHLVEGYGIDADITWLLDYHELHVIPQANPDGRKQAEAGLYWRKNTHPSPQCWAGWQGVDLNRNSTFKWNDCSVSGCSSGDPCALTYRGSSPASEPETQAIESYVASLFPDQRSPNDVDAAPSETEGLFISLHSYSELILYPWGWTNTPAPNGAALQTLGRKFGYYTGYEVCQLGAPSCLYLVDGATDDWVYGMLGVAAFTFELGTAFFQACSTFEEEILDDGLASLLYAMKAARRPYEAPSGPEVLDVMVSTDVVRSGETVDVYAVADDTRFDSNGHGGEPVQAIDAARYTVDAPSWITGTVAYSMTVLGDSPAISETYTATIAGTIDTTDWTSGRHLLLVEARDADGDWGVPSATYLRVLPAPTAVETGVQEPSRSSASNLYLPMIH